MPDYRFGRCDGPTLPLASPKKIHPLPRRRLLLPRFGWSRTQMVSYSGAPIRHFLLVRRRTNPPYRIETTSYFSVLWRDHRTTHRNQAIAASKMGVVCSN
jgi:hypothetical protein